MKYQGNDAFQSLGWHWKFCTSKSSGVKYTRPLCVTAFHSQPNLKRHIWLTSVPPFGAVSLMIYVIWHLKTDSSDNLCPCACSHVQRAHKAAGRLPSHPVFVRALPNHSEFKSLNKENNNPKTSCITITGFIRKYPFFLTKKEFRMFSPTCSP